MIVIADGGPGCATLPRRCTTRSAGTATDGTGLDPFCLKVETFPPTTSTTAKRNVHLEHSYQRGADIGTDRWHPYRLRVNEPLRLGNERVYLTGHGMPPGSP
ncbi:cytochrome c biogenesis protein ResB [Rhodococcus pyridinivorans]|uniref:cytochrome c biogenesis protein ResB n=1 Tax=Rhodococcus pyridinivorans TaxID=103816 RepID=UPI001E38471D|nr:cytochrome c biogenesis protein ResB [Rhodococcus pyridinivorans]UGQ56257.1 cytochrome c biogenesis protein ResB [Rhodococcus pyridinivorans]